ncbi:MAG: D-aminoacyl-tRNA deacylase [candidate division KSB1 bacterium]|nr:D-aminoacyl-tRNA deacylase [candidate division KSB1 bacterium]
MRAVVQRVRRACVRVDGRLVGAIGPGLLVFLGIAASDTEEDARWLCDKALHLRIFANDAGKFDRSVRDVGGEVLVVSQFTLLADVAKGRRPSFSDAAPPDRARELYAHFVGLLRQCGVSCATGEFGAHMEVELVNDGPVTIVMDSPKR